MLARIWSVINGREAKLFEAQASILFHALMQYPRGSALGIALCRMYKLDTDLPNQLVILGLDSGKWYLKYHNAILPELQLRQELQVIPIVRSKNSHPQQTVISVPAGHRIASEALDVAQT